MTLKYSRRCGESQFLMSDYLAFKKHLSRIHRDDSQGVVCAKFYFANRCRSYSTTSNAE